MRNDFELTEREKEVEQYLLLGMTNNQIAEKLIISPHTSKAHISSIFGKLGVDGRYGFYKKIIDELNEKNICLEAMLNNTDAKDTFINSDNSSTSDSILLNMKKVIKKIKHYAVIEYAEEELNKEI